MGRKIFISYKFSDDNVNNISGSTRGSSNVRDYVNEIEGKIGSSDHIYKAESDSEDLSDLTEDQIWEHLKDRIYDSTLTIIMVSPNMKEYFKLEKEQWIPREISYSLKAISRKNKNGDSVTSTENALLAVVVPDRNNSYSYYMDRKSCCSSGCITYKNANLFSIMSNNMFNLKEPNTKECDDGSIIHHGDYSYISVVKWSDFISNMNKYIEKAYDIKENISSYTIMKELS
ncbi:TIR domain-containing protein [Macellibacteroides fermentans]|uniref:TIR domain-containing protein n=1 Tax=Macellibacteroides fermentans TaxID=879969 RepID=UPI00406CE8A1